MRVSHEHYEVMKQFAKKNVNIKLIPNLIRELGSFERAVSWTYITAFAHDWVNYCYNHNMTDPYYDSNLLTAGKKIYRELAEEANIQL